MGNKACEAHKQVDCSSCFPELRGREKDQAEFYNAGLIGAAKGREVEVLDKYKDQIDLYRAGLSEKNARLMFSLAMLSDVSQRMESIQAMGPHNLNRATMTHALRHMNDVDSVLKDARTIIGSVIEGPKFKVVMPAGKEGKKEARQKPG